jgi:hypothetical protein
MLYLIIRCAIFFETYRRSQPAYQSIDQYLGLMDTPRAFWPNGNMSPRNNRGCLEEFNAVQTLEQAAPA